MLERILSSVHLPVSAYLTIIGAKTLIFGTETAGAVEAALPVWLTYVWAALALLGGVVTTGGTLAGRNRLEYVGHWATLSALAIFLLAEGPTSGLLGVLTLAGVTAIRMRVLTRDPLARQEAARLVGREH